MKNFKVKIILTFICGITYLFSYPQKYNTKTDSCGNVIEKKYVDDKGKPTLCHNNSYSSLKTEYNGDSKIIKRGYYGLKEEPVLHRDGYSSTAIQYDNNGNITEQTYYGTDGKPIVIPQGYCKITRTFDLSKNITKESYFDTLLNPILVNGKYASFIKLYDNKNRLIKEQYFGDNGLMRLQSEGYAGRVLGYDNNDNCVLIQYYGGDGKLILYNGKYSIVKREYDNNKQLVKEQFLGVDSTFRMQPEGYASQCFKYDKRGNISEIKYFGLSGEAIMKDNLYHCYKASYDSIGIVTDEIYCDTKNNEISPGGCIKNLITPEVTHNDLLGKYFPVVHFMRFDTTISQLSRQYYTGPYPLTIQSYTKRLFSTMIADKIMLSQDVPLYDPYIEINKYTGIDGLHILSKQRALNNFGYSIDTISILNEETDQPENIIVFSGWHPENIKAIKLIENWAFDAEHLQFYKSIIGYIPIMCYLRPVDDDKKEEFMRLCAYIKQGSKRDNSKKSDFKKIASVSYEYVMYLSDTDGAELVNPDAPALNGQTWEFILKSLINGAKNGILTISNFEDNRPIAYNDFLLMMKNLDMADDDGNMFLGAPRIRSAIFYEDIYFNSKTLEIKKTVNGISPVVWFEISEEDTFPLEYNKNILPTIWLNKPR